MVLKNAIEARLHAPWIADWACLSGFEDLFWHVEDLDFVSTCSLKSQLDNSHGSILWTFEANIAPEAALGRFRNLHPPGHPHFANFETFYAAWCEVMRRWRPLPCWQKIIDEVSVDFAPQMVAIHLRRTDVMFAPNKPINEFNVESYDAALWAQVERVHEAQLEVEFFLTADREDYLNTWQEMLTARGMKVHVYTKEWNPEAGRQTSVGDALVDLYLLAKCQLLLGSVSSSMLRVAKGLGGGEIRLVPPLPPQLPELKPPLRITCIGKTDGAGAQIHAVLSARALAKQAGATFVHTPFGKMAHGGDGTAWERWLGLDKYVGEVVNLRAFAEAGDYEEEVGASRPDSFPVVTFHAEHFHGVTESDPTMFYGPLLEELRADYFPDKDSTPQRMVAVHVRRGDILQRARERIISDEAYLKTIAAIRKEEGRLAPLGNQANSRGGEPPPLPNLPVHIYSDGTPEEFTAFTEMGAVLHCGEDVFTTFHALTVAEILIISNSSFSHIAGLINRGRVVKPKDAAAGYHKLLKHWERL